MSALHFNREQIANLVSSKLSRYLDVGADEDTYHWFSKNPRGALFLDNCHHFLQLSTGEFCTLNTPKGFQVVIVTAVKGYRGDDVLELEVQSTSLRMPEVLDLPRITVGITQGRVSKEVLGKTFGEAYWERQRVSVVHPKPGVVTLGLADVSRISN